MNFIPTTPNNAGIVFVLFAILLLCYQDTFGQQAYAKMLKVSGLAEKPLELFYVAIGMLMFALGFLIIMV